jgi:hypothetical protein
VLDAFHCNSIHVDPANWNLLVSVRQMDSIFYVERSNGKVPVEHGQQGGVDR